MKRFLIVLALLAAVSCLAEEPEEVGITVILTSGRANSLKLSPLIPALGVDNHNGVIVATNNNLFSLNNRRFLLEKPVPVSDYTITPDGALLLISDRKLGYCAGGLFHPQATLPEKDMRLATGEKRIYVFGGDNHKATAIYVIEPGRGHAKLCDMPMPVGAVSVAGEILFFAVSNDIYRIDPGGELNLACRIPGPDITSIAATGNNEFFCTAGLAIYHWQNGRVAIIGEELGDKICWKNPDLYILNTQKQSLIKLKISRSIDASPGKDNEKP